MFIAVLLVVIQKEAYTLMRKESDDFAFRSIQTFEGHWLQNHIQNSHVFIFPSATIRKHLDSMLGRSLAPGQPPKVNSVYDVFLKCYCSPG